MDYNIIKDLLKEKGLSFQDLSTRLGVDRANLYTSLTKGNPTLQRIEAVANALSVPVWRLFTEDKKPELYGIIIYRGQMYSIGSTSDLNKLVEAINQR